MKKKKLSSVDIVQNFEPTSFFLGLSGNSISKMVAERKSIQYVSGYPDANQLAENALVGISYSITSSTSINTATPVNGHIVQFSRSDPSFNNSGSQVIVQFQLTYEGIYVRRIRGYESGLSFGAWRRITDAPL